MISTNGKVFSDGRELSDFTSTLKTKYGWPFTDWTIVDVGACQGHSSVGLALSGAKVVYALEPEPTNFLKLVENIGKSGIHNIVPFNVGLADKSGIRDLLLCPNDHEIHSLKKLWNTNYGKQEGSIRCAFLSWNDFLVTYNVGHVDFCMMDAEGMDEEIVQGMTANLPDRLVVAKYHSVQFSNCMNTEQLCALLERTGYRVHDIAPHDIIASKIV
jgi:FkbM family methyltransferase